jgi:hypothetical protein
MKWLLLFIAACQPDPQWEAIGFVDNNSLACCQIHQKGYGRTELLCKPGIVISQASNFVRTGQTCRVPESDMK